MNEVGDYTVNFMTLHVDLDMSPLLRGLPGDRCTAEHWGYVIKGSMTFRYADHDEVVKAGEAFYATPGHVPVSNEPGTEYVQFTPTDSWSRSTRRSSATSPRCSRPAKAQAGPRGEEARAGAIQTPIFE